jgi:hypothetical protein
MSERSVFADLQYGVYTDQRRLGSWGVVLDLSFHSRLKVELKRYHSQLLLATTNLTYFTHIQQGPLSRKTNAGFGRNIPIRFCSNSR